MNNPFPPGPGQLGSLRAGMGGQVPPRRDGRSRGHGATWAARPTQTHLAGAQCPGAWSPRLPTARAQGTWRLVHRQARGHGSLRSPFPWGGAHPSLPVGDLDVAVTQPSMLLRLR